MKFLIDANLPNKLKEIIILQGHEVIHTLDLPHKNFTTDSEILDYAIKNDFVVLTKDSDFVDSFLLLQKPKKLCLISTGNIKNQELKLLIQANFAKIVELLLEFNFIELNQSNILVHA